MKTIAKIFGLVAVASFALALVVTPVKAATVDELMAQITALTAQLNAMKGGSMMTSSATFNSNLTVGSTGADVTALQNWLASKGFLSATARGYFGPATKAALAAYQASVGITPATGYFGPITRAKVNAEAGSMTTGGTTTTTTTTTTTSGISTNGAEGTITVSQESSGVKTTVYENDSQVPVLGFKIEAKNSDVSFQRVKLNLGTSTNYYTKAFTKFYLTDASGKVLASVPLNSSTVTRDTGYSPVAYTVTIANFSTVIPKDSKYSFYIKADVSNSISSEYRGTYTLALASTDPVRVVDGAGIDQYGGGPSITQNVTVSRSLADSATLTLSTDPNVLKAQTVVANKGSNNDELDAQPVASFTALAEKDGVLIRDLTVTASSTVGQATQPTAYLYVDGSQIASASASVNGATTTYAFTSIDYSIPKDVTKTFEVRVDVRTATTVADNFVVTGVTVPSAESKTSGNGITVSPLATVGNTIAFVSKGSSVQLSSNNIDIAVSKDQNAATIEAHLTATFNVTITAIGADAVFTAPTSSFAFTLIKNGVATTTPAGNLTVYYPSTVPSGATNYSATGFTIPRNATVTIPVTYKVDAVGSSTVSGVLPNGNYSVRLGTINYTSGGTAISNDYSTNSAWVTSEKVRP